MEFIRRSASFSRLFNSAFRNPHFAFPTAFTLPKLRERSAFTLLELLVVVGIIALLSVLVVPAFTARKSADNVTNSIFDVNGALEAARTFAMSNNTYAWIGFFEEDVVNTPSTKPRPAGTGRIIISIVASKEGNRYKDTQVDATEPHAFYPSIGPTPLPSNDLNPVALTQVGKLIKVENAHIAALPAGVLTRPAVPTKYQVAANDFAFHPPTLGTVAVQNPTTFNYPLSATSPDIVYTFTKIIEFTPRGEAVKIVDLPTQLMELGLQPTHGNSPDTATPNVAAIQVAAATGRTKIYRR